MVRLRLQIILAGSPPGNWGDCMKRRHQEERTKGNIVRKGTHWERSRERDEAGSFRGRHDHGRSSATNNPESYDEDSDYQHPLQYDRCIFSMMYPCREIIIGVSNNDDTGTDELMAGLSLSLPSLPFCPPGIWGEFPGMSSRQNGSMVSIKYLMMTWDLRMFPSSEQGQLPRSFQMMLTNLAETVVVILPFTKVGRQIWYSTTPS